MTPPTRTDKLTPAALWAGVAVPVFYFGLQLLAAPFFPGYSFLTNTVSDLGSDRSSQPWVANGGAILTGLVSLLAAYGYLRGLRALGVGPVLAWAAATVVALGGLTHLWAGVFPLPDPRHGQNPPTVGLLLTPLVLALALWKPGGPALRAYLAANLAVFGALVLVFTGVILVDRPAYAGLIQRVLGLAVVVPVGVGAYFLLRRTSQ